MIKFDELAKPSSRRCRKVFTRRFHRFRWRTHTYPNCRTAPKRANIWRSTWAVRTFAWSYSSWRTVRYSTRISSSTIYRMRHVSAADSNCLIISLSAYEISCSWRECQSTWKSRWALHSHFRWDNTRWIPLSSSHGRNRSIVPRSSIRMSLSCFSRRSRRTGWTTSMFSASSTTPPARW